MKISRNVPTADLTLFAKRLRSMNERTNIPFYIFAPDYRDSSGGIRVLHYLCHILNEMGEEAYIVNARKTSPHLLVCQSLPLRPFLRPDIPDFRIAFCVWAFSVKPFSHITVMA